MNRFTKASNRFDMESAYTEFLACAKIDFRWPSCTRMTGTPGLTAGFAV